MANASNYLELKVLDHVLGEGARDFTSPTTLFLGLFTAVSDPDAGSVTEVPSLYGYVRKDLSFNTASAGAALNSADITFPTASGGAWGTITHVGVYDSQVGGTDNLLVWAALAASKVVSDGDTFVIQASNLTVNMA